VHVTLSLSPSQSLSVSLTLSLSRRKVNVFPLPLDVFPLASNAKDVSRLREGGAPRVEEERGAEEQAAEMERVEHCSEERAARSHVKRAK